MPASPKNFAPLQRRAKALAVCFGLSLGLMGTAFPGLAQETESSQDALRATLSGLMDTHQRVLAAKADLSAADEDAKEAWGDWYPNIALSGENGFEHRSKHENSNTNTTFYTVGATLTQRVADFGATNAAIDSADLSRGRSAAALDQVRQDLLLDAMTARLETVRAYQTLTLADKSVENIQTQAQMEDARVQAGAGLSTDLLQTKAQLAGAQARRVQAKGLLEEAVTFHTAIFKAPPPEMSDLDPPEFPAAHMPETLEDALEVAVTQNPAVKLADYDLRIDTQAVTETQSESFYPTVDLVATGNYDRNAEGTLGPNNDMSVKLQVSMDFNAGLTAINSLRASRHRQTAAHQRLYDARSGAEEEVKSAWKDLETAKQLAELRESQAGIAQAYLDLARKERESGDRSLISVLTGETTLFNASSDAASAKIDVTLAAYTLLHAMGVLTLDKL